MYKASVVLCMLSLAVLLSKASVQVGADVFFEHTIERVKGKRLGVIINHSALLSTGEHLLHRLLRDERVRVTAIYAPEHGLASSYADGDTVADTIDPKTGIPVYSLYKNGALNDFTQEMLQNIDVLMYDIQNVGARFYTFESVLVLSLKAAAQYHKPLIVLDRPPTLIALYPEGPVLGWSLQSTVGLAPLPIVHGLTVGELALFVSRCGWSPEYQTAKLTVVPMRGWQRSMSYQETGLPWVKPSPNIYTEQTAQVYPGTCLLEATNISEGRGTHKPFECIGAPWIDSNQLATELNAQKLPGVMFEPSEFIPCAIPGVAESPKYKDTRCKGVFIRVTDRASFRPVSMGITLLGMLKKLYPIQLAFKQDQFDRLVGNSWLRPALMYGVEPCKIEALWQKRLIEYRVLRDTVLIYSN